MLIDQIINGFFALGLLLLGSVLFTVRPPGKQTIAASQKVGAGGSCVVGLSFVLRAFDLPFVLTLCVGTVGLALSVWGVMLRRRENRRGQKRHQDDT